MTVRTFDDGCDRWEITEAAPVLALTPHVGCYGAWRECTQSFSTRRELAATCGVFIVNLGASLEIVDARGTLHRLDAGDGFIGGMAQATSLSRSTGEMAGLHIHMPVEKLAAIGDCTVRLDDVARKTGRSLGGRLVEARDTATRFAILDTFIAERLSDSMPADPRLAYALSYLRTGAPVSALAVHFDWSRKHLARWFRDETGLLPRQFLRLARFERFTAALQCEPCDSLAELAFTHASA